MLQILRYLISTICLVFLAACGGGSSSTSTTSTVGGTVFGLTSGKSFQLDLNTSGSGSSSLADTRRVTVGGEFTFGPNLSNGVTYTVSVSTQPYGQFCSVRNNTGTLSGNVTNVFVDCVDRGAFVFAVNELNATVGSYTIDYGTGALTSAGTPVSTLTRGIESTFPAPKNITLHPSGKFAYVSNEGANTIIKYSVNTTTGSLSSPVSTTGITAPRAIAIDKEGKYAYVGNATGLSWYSIDSTTGALTNVGSIDFPDDPISLDKFAFDPSGDFLYAANHPWGNFLALQINHSTGGVTKRDRVGTGSGVCNEAALIINAVAVAPNGYIYLATGSYGDPGGVKAMAFDKAIGTNGAFDVDVCTNASSGLGIAQSLAIHPSGKYLYVTIDSSVVAYEINTITSALTRIGSPLATASSPTSITVEPGGKYLYVSLGASNAISSYAINASTGALTLLGVTSTGSGTQPEAVTSY